MKTILIIFLCMTLSLLFSLAFEVKGKVISIHDGDTLKIRTQENKVLTIRLQRIDTPEVY